MKPAEAFAARRAVMAAIEKESLDKTGLRIDVVTLYQGGAYHLYRYKKYTDVRLVFAPEEKIAGVRRRRRQLRVPALQPRCLLLPRLRGRQAGAVVKHWFKLSAEGAKDGDLVFVTGHPGTTNRLETLDKLKHRRDITLPYTLARIAGNGGGADPVRRTRSREQAAGDHGSASRTPTRARRSRAVPGAARTRRSLQDEGGNRPAVVHDRSTFRARSHTRAPTIDAVKRIAECRRRYATFEKPYNLLETGTAFPTHDCSAIARHLVRLTSGSRASPTASACASTAIRTSNRSSSSSSRRRRSTPDLERTKLLTGITFLAEQLGGEHPLVLKVLDGKSPAKRVDELLATKLFDPAERKRLVEGGAKAIDASADPMIVFARAIDADARDLRKRFENEVEEPERQAYARDRQGALRHPRQVDPAGCDVHAAAGLSAS